MIGAIFATGCFRGRSPYCFTPKERKKWEEERKREQEEEREERMRKFDEAVFRRNARILKNKEKGEDNA